MSIYGDTHPDNPTFTPGEEIRSREKDGIFGSDYVQLNPYACSGLRLIKGKSDFGSPQYTESPQSR